MYGPFFITIVRDNLVNCGDLSRVSVNSCSICAAFDVFLTNSGSFLAVFLHKLLHIIVNWEQYPDNSGQIKPNPVNIHYCFLPVL